MTWIEHESSEIKDIKVAIKVVSDSLFNSQSPEIDNKDKSGTLAIEFLLDKGIKNSSLEIIPDGISGIRTRIEAELMKKTDLIVFLGGSGLGKRDFTYEAIVGIIEREFIGFGEEFRRKSIEVIGKFGMLSRTIAGTYKNSLVVGLPGSPDATELGLKLVLSVTGHILNLIK